MSRKIDWGKARRKQGGSKTDLPVLGSNDLVREPQRPTFERRAQPKNMPWESPRVKPATTPEEFQGRP